MKTLFALLATSAAVLILAPIADGHFKLNSPPSWVTESKLGDPQKAGPCGVSDATQNAMPSGIVTPVQGGSMLHIQVQETVFHPGHYRIALAVNSRAELPADPPAETREGAKGPQSVSAPIMNPVRPPVLMDGLWAHTSKAENPMFETDVRIPNIRCAKCTLQIIQFMAEHGRNKEGDFSYHHCADLAITPDAGKPMDQGWPAAR